MFPKQNTRAARMSQLGFVTTLILTIMSVFSGLDTGAQTSDGTVTHFALTISAEPNKVKSGTPILLGVIIKNISTDEISIPRNAEGSEREYLVDVKNQKGGAPPETEFKRSYSCTNCTTVGGHTGRDALKSGESLKDEFNLSKVHDLNSAGTYTVQLQRFDYQSKIYVKSNIITVTVIQ